MMKQKKENTRKGRRMTLHSVQTSLAVSFIAIQLSYSITGSVKLIKPDAEDIHNTNNDTGTIDTASDATDD